MFRVFDFPGFWFTLVSKINALKGGRLSRVISLQNSILFFYFKLKLNFFLQTQLSVKNFETSGTFRCEIVSKQSWKYVTVNKTYIFTLSVTYRITSLTRQLFPLGPLNWFCNSRTQNMRSNIRERESTSEKERDRESIKDHIPNVIHCIVELVHRNFIVT